MKKSWYKSKTIWSAVAMFVLALVQLTGFEVPTELYTLAGSFGLYGLRDAMKN